MRCAIPPVFSEILPGNAEAILNLLNQTGPVDSQGRYLHWDEFKWRTPKGIQPEVAWCATKIARQKLAKPLTHLVGADGQSQMTYWLPDNLYGYLRTIDRLGAPLIQLYPQDFENSRNQYLVESLLMEEAISSAQLEGAATTRKVAKVMLETGAAPKSEHERMIVNNFRLMKAAKHYKDTPLTLGLIQTLHAIATDNTDRQGVVPGEFRTSDDIVVADNDGTVLHQPPKWQDIPHRLQQLCDFANTNHHESSDIAFIHPAVKAIILHFIVGYEHPFADGNGRTARAIFYWYMLKNGYALFEYVSISSLLKNAPVQYGMSYLYVETDDLDLTYFIDYQLRTIDKAIKNFVDYLEKKRQDYYETLSWLDDTGIANQLNYRQTMLLRKALQHPGRAFTTKEVMSDFNISENTARTDLGKLVSLKVLMQAKETNNKTIQFIARADAKSMLQKH